jgi:acetyl esterase/lipase
MLTGFSRAVLPPFEKSYRAWAKKKNVHEDVVDVPNTKIKGFWIGNQEKASTVMVYFHGGGFVIPGMPPHIDMLVRWVDWSDGRMAIFCPCYTLSPEAVYPQAIGECVEALRWITDKYADREVCIGGDSAGGNLVLAMLSHVSGHAHPNTEVVKELKLKKPLKAAIAIAPWTSSDGEKFPEMVTNSYRDVINVWVAVYWLDTYKGGKGKPDDPFTMPETADAGWWSGCKDTVGYVLATAGEMEVLRDPIISWAKKYEEAVGKDKFRCVVADNEIHDHPMNPYPEEVLKKDVDGTKTQEGAIYKWIKENI